MELKNILLSIHSRMLNTYDFYVFIDFLTKKQKIQRSQKYSFLVGRAWLPISDGNFFFQNENLFRIHLNEIWSDVDALKLMYGNVHWYIRANIQTEEIEKIFEEEGFFEWASQALKKAEVESYIVFKNRIIRNPVTKDEYEDSDIEKSIERLIFVLKKNQTKKNQKLALDFEKISDQTHTISEIFEIGEIISNSKAVILRNSLTDDECRLLKNFNINLK